MGPNRVLRKLRNGEWVLVSAIVQIPSFKIVEIMGMAGEIDCVWIDIEHNDFSYDRLAEMAAAARETGIEPMVRIAKGGYTSIIRPLEAGATGLMIPHCMSAGEAKQVVRDAKFSPLGLRGYSAGGVDAQYTMMKFKEYIQWANSETFIAVQIEDREAVDSVEEIAAVEGIDILFVGPADLSQSYGVFGKFRHPKILRAIDKVAEAAKAYGKWWGMPVSSPKEAEKLIGKGARFLSHGSDVRILAEGFRDIAEKFAPLR
ncbi:MAG: HpcH/HpaI aldolase family protein [bacterium]